MPLSEVQKEMIRTDQPANVGRLLGMSFQEATKQYLEAEMIMEKEGCLGSMTREDIQKELNFLRSCPACKKQRYGNLTDEAILDEEDFLEEEED